MADKQITKSFTNLAPAIKAVKPLSTQDLEKFTYQGPKVDNTLAEKDLARKCPLDNGRHPLKPVFDLGDLEMLPLEVLSAALAELDLKTLTDFRRVNQRAMQVVDSVPQYSAIVTHIPDALRGILSIETGRYITCQLLYDKFCTAKCEHCGDFGGYLYLLTCKRVCIICSASSPVTMEWASRNCGLDWDGSTTWQKDSAIPHMKNLPGGPRRWKPQQYLLDYESARNVGIERHGSATGMRMYCVERGSGGRSRRFRQMNQENGTTLPPPPCCLGCVPRENSNRNPYSSLRFIAILPVPWWDKKERSLDWGFHCIGCRKRDGGALDCRRKFTVATFEDHIRLLGGIRDGSHISKL